MKPNNPPAFSSPRHRGSVASRIPNKIMLSLSSTQAVALTQLCRQHGLLDESVDDSNNRRWAARGVEMIRVLLVAAVTPDATSSTTAAVALRLNAKMFVASVGNKLSKTLGGSVASAATPIAVPSKIRLSLDASMQKQLERFVPLYRAGGKIQVSKMVLELLGRGLADHRLNAILTEYVPIMNAFRVKVLELEGQMQQAVLGLAAQVTAKAA